MVKTFTGQGDMDGKALTQSSHLRQLITKGVTSLSLFLLRSRKSQIQLGGQRLSIGSTHRDQLNETSFIQTEEAHYSGQRYTRGSIHSSAKRDLCPR
ncbi:hypothetical protein [Pseudomonas syringae]|uniref:hypothetical protein n=1 Tax=Pseudomonas syringae TaxID=317 RepID=UPI0012BA901F|nr:hypothetical protein [Pseudomonas syringae]